MKRAIEDGFVRVTPGRNKHQAFTISYLTGPQRKKIKSGELVVTGTREDGSKIVVLPTGKSIRWTTTWRDKAHDAGAYGTSLLGQFVPGRRFPYPKSLYAVEDCLRLFLKKKTNAVILDFFAGSGTTGHAVMRLNKDGGRRRFILVSNNEVSSEEESVLAGSGLEPGSKEWEAAGIFETILWPRIKAAVTGRRPDGEKVEGDYKFGDEFPMSDGFEENVAYFKLDFLDPGDVTRGEKFESIVPIVWMLAGCRGACDTSKGTVKWFMPKHNPFAVLHDEDAIGDFARKLAERPDIDHVFLVTDSTEG
ncbi:MAG TPA: DNA methyltransferase, partial [Nitrospiraceae bacterium]|nr:DNA methyltransferase [Nitrospiraceae bacterium]